MANTHPSDVAPAYQALEPSVREELNQQIDAEFRRRHPGIALGRPLDTRQTDKLGVKEWLKIRDELYQKLSNGPMKTAPKRVVQNDTMFCWAAALESWLAAVRGLNINQEELRKKYSTHPSGALDLTNIHNFDKVAKPLHINWEAKPGPTLTYSYFYNLLAKRGHLLVMYLLSPGISHTVVVYGAGIPGDGKSVLYIMDPSASKGYDLMYLQDLRLRSLTLVGWEPR